MNKLITTKDYILWVDTDAEIIEGEYINDEFGLRKARWQVGKEHHQPKVIAHKPLNNAPKLEGVLLLPELNDEPDEIYVLDREQLRQIFNAGAAGHGGHVRNYVRTYNGFEQFESSNEAKFLQETKRTELPKQEDDVEQLAYNELARILGSREEADKGIKANDAYCMKIVNTFKVGYKANTGKWSDEDMKKAIELARDITDGKDTFDVESIAGLTETDTYGWKVKYSTNEILQSLSPATLTPVDFEPEYEYVLSNKDIEQAEEGDFVMNNHGSKGIINSLSDDIRVGIGNFVEVSQTGDNGHDTLNINGYKIYNKKFKTIQTEEGETIVGKWIFKN